MPTVGEELPCRQFLVWASSNHLLLWILRLSIKTLAFAASIDEDGTILDRGPLGSGRFLFTVK